MPETRKLGDVSSSDLHLIQRVTKLIEEARVAQEMLQAHLAAEYGLEQGQAITFAGEIVEPVATTTSP